MREYINDPGSIEFWDLNQEKIRKAHQSILKEFELVMENLRKDIKSGEFEAEEQKDIEADSINNRLLEDYGRDEGGWNSPGGHCYGLADLFYMIDRTVGELYQPDYDREGPKGDTAEVVAAITRAYIRLGSELYFVSPRINQTLTRAVEDNDDGLILDDLALTIYQIAEYQANRNHKALPEMNKAELLRYLERLSIEEIRSELKI
jgi:hypothetical protein